MTASMKIVKNAFDKYKENLLKPERKLMTFFQKTAYPTYQKLQFERFKSEGTSEGGGFLFPLSSKKWQAVKIRKKEENSSQYPGGEKRLVYTGGLASSVIGPLGASVFQGAMKGNYHRKYITPKSMIIATTIPYGHYVVDWITSKGRKSYMSFGQNSWRKFREQLELFVKEELFS